MKLINDVKNRLFIRVFCKLAKARGLEMEETLEAIEEMWERA